MTNLTELYNGCPQPFQQNAGVRVLLNNHAITIPESSGAVQPPYPQAWRPYPETWGCLYGPLPPWSKGCGVRWQDPSVLSLHLAHLPYASYHDDDMAAMAQPGHAPHMEI